MKHQIAEVSLKYKTHVPIEKMPEVTRPNCAVEILRSIWNTDTIQLKEEFIVLLLSCSIYLPKNTVLSQNSVLLLIELR